MSLANRLTALQYRDFRLLWFGQAISTIGSQMQFIAVNWHIYSLLRGQVWELSLFGQTIPLDTGALGLGLTGLVRVLPIMVFALLGGVLADVVPRRRLLLFADSFAALFAGLLAGVAFLGWDNVPVLYLLTACGAAVSALGTPARQAIVPNLVAPKDLTNAVSLNTLLGQIGTIVGPGIAGLLVGFYNVGLVYTLNALSFGAVLLALLLMRHRGTAASREKMNWGMVAEGLRFTYHNKILWSTVLLDFFATLFGSARTMLPIVADQILGLGPEGYGLLATAQPVGALLAGTFLSLRSQIRRQGEVLLLSVALYGVATAVFGLSTSFWFSYLLFGLTGVGDTISTVIRGTIRQVVTPDELRGRATSISMVFFMGGPQLGEVEAGLAAALFGVPFAIVSGGLACVGLVGFVAWRYPRLRHYRPDTAVL